MNTTERFKYAVPFGVVANFVVVAGYDFSVPAFISVASWFYGNTPINLFALDYGRTVFLFYLLTWAILTLLGYLLAPRLAKTLRTVLRRSGDPPSTKEQK